jgi:hypothetical protein
VNLVGHVAVALAPDHVPDDEFLVGCILPDVAAIARVRLAGPRDGEVARGVAFHHACDTAFHDSAWFRARSREIRDELLARDVDAGPARACAHAGLEMVLDGALVRDGDIAEAACSSLDAMAQLAPSLAGLVAPPDRDRWVEVATRVGRNLDPRAYADADAVAIRLVRMTAGRRRIELRPQDAGVVASTLGRHAAACATDAATVVVEVRAAVAG